MTARVRMMVGLMCIVLPAAGPFAVGDPVVGDAFELRRAEQDAFRQPKWSRYGSRAQIPAGEKETFESDVDGVVRQMWQKKRAGDVVADAATLRQFRQFVGTFRSAYLQMVLTEESLRIWGRALAPEYGK